MSSNATIARPYADAVFRRAVETASLDQWSDMLALLGVIMADNRMLGLVSNPRLDREQLAELILEVAGDRLSAEGANLVRLLADNDRLAVAPDLAALYEELKQAHEHTIDVDVTSAFPLDDQQIQILAAALKRHLGRDIHITSSQDESLIGGVRIRAGDLVIDGSVRGRLAQLATELGT